jgi:Ca2+-binding EF-hand superfamily protein
MVLPILASLFLIGDAFSAAVPARPRKKRPEGLDMFLAIIGGKPIGPGSGWFKPSQSKYSWTWLAAQMDVHKRGVITRKEFKGSDDLFARLDRDGDGKLTPADFDWSPRSKLAMQEGMAGMLFRIADDDTDGRISAKEWKKLFKQAAKGKDHLTPEDVRAMLFPSAPPRTGKPPPGSGMPAIPVLLKGFITGEIGSMSEGPSLGAKAPDFRLQTHDGQKEIALSDYRGKKPVVLIFGSFT